jgi:hypothetical protein
MSYYERCKQKEMFDMMKEVYKLLEVLKEDTFTTAVMKRIVKWYLKGIIWFVLLFIRLTSNKEDLQKFKEELGV